MACGTPIVTSNLNGLKKITGDAVIQVDADDPDAIVAGISRILTHTDLQASLSQRALARSKHFSWEKCVRQTLDILESRDR